ncbi:membrane protein TmpA [Treponema phagedenis]|nr:hypothetical protein [Treponema phagedenis]ADZ48054.1 TmpA [Treponema sp. V1]NVP24685.1 membrane protein TmpA [Treponema phagedenis]QEJ95702.1 membrane protein TmpA [Treponema phagedenis]QEJ98800.1 membrane protein TmpA [Treponema phagedenis]QEK00533.1 membrane protein TmpA [Treponema phagedenis]
MKLKTLVFSLSALFLVLGFTGCKSKAQAKAEQEAQERKALMAENAKIEKRLMQAKNAATEAEANVYYPEKFAQIEDLEKQSSEAKEQDDLKKANSLGSAAADKYETLANKMKIANQRSKIEANKLAKYDEESYRLGEEAEKKIDGLYESDSVAALQTSNESLMYYNKVIDAGYKSLSQDAKKTADDAKAALTAVKVAASLKPQQEEADGIYAKAEEAENSAQYEQSYGGYTSAAQAYNDLTQIIKAKRLEAQKAMQAAKTKQELSAKLANEADKESPLPENAEGFSKEPIEVEPLPTDVLNAPQDEKAEETVPVEEMNENSSEEVNGNAEKIESTEEPIEGGVQ